MNPGLVVKIRPTGPWRIGSDSGARNRVDAIYHSDSLYAAVASAMARLGMLAEWLDATARAQSPAVCFSSCFPFLNNIDFIVPPRTAWPPTQPGVPAHVRWKSARFVPVSLLQSILAGRKPDENKWGVDALSECLVPAGKPGPFRTSVRSNAAVDRLTGATERHSIACTEFRKGAGLWAIVSFADEAARDQWQEPVKAAFRWLADSGFGGERSRGWGRSEAPEFVEGTLPEMVIGSPEEGGQGPGGVPADFAGRGQGLEPPQPAAEPVLAAEEPKPAPEEGGQGPGAGGQGLEPPQPSAEPVLATEEPKPAPTPEKEPPTEPEPMPPVEEPREEPAVEEPPAGPPETDPPAEPQEGEASIQARREIAPLAVEPEPVGQTSTSAADLQVGLPPQADAPAAELDAESEGLAVVPVAAEAIAEPEARPAEAAGTPPGPQPPAPESAAELDAESEGLAATPAIAEEVTEPEAPASPQPPAPGPRPPAPELTPSPQSPVPVLGRHWLLSLFTPAAADTVDWSRGNYTVMTRCGRVDSAGDLKKQLVMVAEGSVVCAAAAPQGAAPDVAPDGFARPVYRAGFALTIPLPEAR